MNKPLSYFTNRLAIVFIIVFFLFSIDLVFRGEDSRERVITMLIATAGAIIMLVVTIATPNKQVEWISKLIERNYKGDKNE